MSAIAAISPQTQPVKPAADKEVLPVQKPLEEVGLSEDIQPLYVQPKLTVGAPDDPYEKEADAVADKVMRMPDQNFVQRQAASEGEPEKLQRQPEKEDEQISLKKNATTSFLQRKCTECEQEEKEAIHRKPISESITPVLQTKSDGQSAVSKGVATYLQASRGNGSNLDGNTQTFMSSRFGSDFSQVKIHTGSDAVQLSQDLNAKAFTIGNDIYFNQGQYNPGSFSGKELLAHELTHTLQQGGITVKKKTEQEVTSEVSDSNRAESFIQCKLQIQSSKIQTDSNTALKQEIQPEQLFNQIPSLHNTISATAPPDDPHSSTTSTIMRSIQKTKDARTNNSISFLQSYSPGTNVPIIINQESNFIQRKCASCENEEEVHRKVQTSNSICSNLEYSTKRSQSEVVKAPSKPSEIIQRSWAGDTLQRKVGDIDMGHIAPQPQLDKNLEILFRALDELGSPHLLSQVLVVSGSKGKLFSVKRTKDNITKKIIGNYQFKAIGMDPSYLIGLANDKFSILGYQGVTMPNGDIKISYALLGGHQDTPEAKVMSAKLEKTLTLPEWFINEKDRGDFYDKMRNPAGFAIIILPFGGGMQGKTGDDAAESEPPPPMPAWMKAYRTQMKQLIADLKKSDNVSTDIPDDFYTYYSATKSAWRAAASQATDKPKEPLKVYFDITEKDDKPEKLKEIRDRIRIRQLKAPEKLSPDSKPLDAKHIWAYRIKVELDKKIAEERKNRPDAADLPDKTSITTKDDGTEIPFLRLWLYIRSANEAGESTSVLKNGVMASPLMKGMDVDALFADVLNATRELRGHEIKPVDADPKKFAKVDKAFPAIIESLNVRDDYRGVTSGKLEMVMNLNMSNLGLLGETASRYVGIIYTWDVYRVNEVIPGEDLAKMPKTWEDRRKSLQNWFKGSYQLKDKNPAFSVSTTGPIETLSPQDITRGKKLGLIHGTLPSYSNNATIGMPKEEGEYVIFCRAQPHPGKETYREPSEAFFTVSLTEGYRLAEEVRDERLKEIERLKAQIKEETNDEKRKELQQKLDALTTKEKHTLTEGTLDAIGDQRRVITLAKKLEELYKKANSDKNVSDLIEEEATAGKIDVNDFDSLLKMYMWLETNNRDQSPADKIKKLIKDAEQNITQMQGAIKRVGMFSEELKGYDIMPTPVVGLVSKVTGQVYPLLLTLGVGSIWGGAMRAMLVDVTTEETQNSYAGESKKTSSHGGTEEAIRDAFEQFGRKCAYGEGYIAYRIPGTSAQGRVPSQPGTWEKVKRILGIVAAIAGIIALIVGTIFTGGALAVVAGYVGIGAMLVGAGLAIENIYDRASNHRLHADVELAMDLLNVAGPVLQGAGALAKIAKLNSLRTLVATTEAMGDVAGVERGAISVAMLGNLPKLVRLERTLMFIQKGEAITNLGLVGYQTYRDLAVVAEVYANDPKKLAAMQHEIIKNALISGTFAIIALRSEFKMRNSDELDALVNNIVKDRDYHAAMVKSGLKDADGNWRNPKLQEFFLKKKTDSSLENVKVEEEPLDAAGKQELDVHEKNRQVEMKGHAKTPDGAHEVEVYKDSSIGRCSSVTGQKCPVLELVFSKVLGDRPMIKKELAELRADMAKYGDNIPKKKMEQLANLEQRLRRLEQASTNSLAPKDYKIKEVSYDFDDVSQMTGKVILEFPNGERVWRDANGTHHEADIRGSIGRQHWEKDYYSATESGITRMKGTERAHSFGQGFGWESPFALFYAPRFVNQKLQNNGIEQFIRNVRGKLPAGQKLILKTTTKAEGGTRALKSIGYEGFILTATGEKIPVFQYKIDVTWKKVGGSVVEADPIKFLNNLSPAAQKVINDFKGLTPDADMPHYIVNKIREDISL